MGGAVPYSRTVVGALPWYSVLIVLGILLCFWIGSREEKRKGLPKDTMLDVTLVAVPCGIIGARLYYVLFSLDQFRDNWISALYIWNGGIAIYGAVIGGALGVYAYARRKKLRFLTLLDIVAPGLVLAQAIGRWGNYFNMEAYGAAVDNPAWQFFPLCVFIPQGAAGAWHMATFFYESVWDLGCFIALMALRKRTRRDGDLIGWYLLAYGSGRFLIEQFRTDSLYWGALRVSQWLSLLFMTAVAVIWLKRLFEKASARTFGYAVSLCALALVRFVLPVGVAWAIPALALCLITAALVCVTPGARAPLAAVLLALDAALALWMLIAPQSLPALLAQVYRSVSLPFYLGGLYRLLSAATSEREDEAQNEHTDLPSQTDNAAICDMPDEIIASGSTANADIAAASDGAAPSDTAHIADGKTPGDSANASDSASPDDSR